ncbi:hypothetical protein DESUT3_04960 [Desulfuromonas versatilis]|uniref:histidine kinase n=1 Tax=Desulfuromonas versatilis TaxID=2802975 RepID=A0ABN6DUL4_9BACT|nr:ATP-binding protein [Desulfuromonas versatilis]BCR03427.1 hypothetical protein DESUT3_04960 [Desulfuromonas versatilis]
MSRKLALVVDDNADDRRLLKHYLEQRGYATLQAGNGEAALEAAQASPPDLIVSDALMPDMDGFQLLRRVRHSSRLKLTPFIFYSAVYTGQRDQELALSLGADAFIVKPKEPEAFWRELDAALARNHAARRAAAEELPDEESFLRKYSAIVARKVEEKVAELKRTQAELELGERKYRNIFNSITDVILVSDFTRRVIDANRPALDTLFGYSLEEVRGTSAQRFYAEEADFEAVGCFFIEASCPREPLEVLGLRKDGSTFAAEVRGLRLSDESGQELADITIWRDISERRRTAQELRQALAAAKESREQIDAILRSVADGLLVTDGENRLIMMNRPAEDLLGVSMEEAFQKPIGTVIRQSALQQHLAVLSGTSGETLLDLELTDKSRGEIRIIQAHTAPVQSRSAGKTGVITILRDVTRDREITRLKSEFISIAAHELRTPLASVMGFAELLLVQGEALDAEQRREFQNYIFEKACVLEKIIDDLLDLSRIESGRPLQLEKAPCDLRRTIEGLVGQYRKESARHRFELQLAEGPAVLDLDQGKIVQVLENLLSNAVKYSPRGGSIQVTGAPLEHHYQVRIADQGVGMTPEQLERVFDKFYRADTSDTAVPGLGLGMSIVKVIIEDHGGDIRVESQPGLGTQVTFRLPLGDNGSRGPG